MLEIKLTKACKAEREYNITDFRRQVEEQVQGERFKTQVESKDQEPEIRPVSSKEFREG